MFCKSVLNLGEADVAEGEKDGLLDGDTTQTIFMREKKISQQFAYLLERVKKSGLQSVDKLDTGWGWLTGKKSEQS